MNRLIAVGVLVTGLGVGGWSGYQLGSVGSAGADEPLAKADASALTKLVPGLSAGRADVDSAALRTLIREEMTAALARAGNGFPTAPAASGGGSGVSTALAAGGAGSGLPTVLAAGSAGKGLPTAAGRSGVAAGAAPAQETVSPEKQAQRREALEQVSAMVAQGTWGNDQRMSFLEKLSILDPQQRDQAMQRFATAVNNGSLTISTDGPPL